MLQQRGWVAGWVSATLRYCIKTAKPILKLVRPSGSPVILVSSDPCADTQFQGEPLQRGRYTGSGKNWLFFMNIFIRYYRAYTFECRRCRWLVCHAQRTAFFTQSPHCSASDCRDLILLTDRLINVWVKHAHLGGGHDIEFSYMQTNHAY